MYTVHAVYELEPEWRVGFYDTQEEAEEVATDVFEEYDDEVDRVEVRDRWGEVVMVVGGD
jgi:hypothetical protein